MSSHSLPSDLIVKDGQIRLDDQVWRCAVGRSGVSDSKQEGDGATPAGCFVLQRVYWRSDRLDAPITSLPIQALQSDDGWCDDPGQSSYNRPIKLPHAGSYEVLWRHDHIYDLIVSFGFNDDPPVPGLGSVIFMHVAREGYTPTDGCIAVAQADLLAILALVQTGSRICIETS